MKRFVSLLLCVLMVCGCAFAMAEGEKVGVSMPTKDLQAAADFVDFSDIDDRVPAGAQAGDLGQADVFPAAEPLQALADILAQVDPDRIDFPVFSVLHMRHAPFCSVCCFIIP